MVENMRAEIIRLGGEVRFGEKVDRYPELAQQIHAAGHELANHTWSHPQSTFWCRGPQGTRREIERCQRSIEQATGVSPSLFRAPVGHHNLFVHEVLRDNNLALVGWSSRGYDAVSTAVEKVRKKLCASMQPGAIILAHEATPIAAEVIQSILEHAKDQYSIK